MITEYNYFVMENDKGQWGVYRRPVRSASLAARFVFGGTEAECHRWAAQRTWEDSA